MPFNSAASAGPDAGAMGLHYVNSALVQGCAGRHCPQIVIYEPTAVGGLKLIGADYLLIADAWDAKHKTPPELMGQLFHYWESPNRFGLPAFYTLHVWAWKDNPNGAFVNWHPTRVVSVVRRPKLTNRTDGQKETNPNEYSTESRHE